MLQAVLVLAQAFLLVEKWNTSLSAEFIKLPAYTAVVSYKGAVGTLRMPKYWECFNMPQRTKLKTVSDFKALQTVA